MNTVEVIGFVGQDPEERVTPSGRKVITLRLADNIRSSGGKEETIWWRVTCWGDQFDKIMPYIKKGTLLVVHGEMRRLPETYQDREGHTRVSLEVTAMQLRLMPSGRQDKAPGEDKPAAYAPASQGNSYTTPPSVPGGFKPAVGSSTGNHRMEEFNEDNLPF